MKLTELKWETFLVYLLNDVKLSSKESSVSAIKSRFKKLSLYFVDKDFDRENFNTFIQELREAKYSVSYINNFIKMAKHVDKYLKLNQLPDYTYFKENRVWTGDTLTPEQIESIASVNLKYSKYSDFLNKRNRAIVLLLGTTGCRIEEAINLKSKDLHQSPTYIIFRDTKNNDDRVVPISSQLFEMLVELSANNECVFLSYKGKPLRSQEINLDLKRRAKACSITIRVYNHLFRHSFITTMKEAGVDNADIAHIVGHRDPKTTARYTHGTLNYYNQVIHNHPLLKKEITFEQMKENLKKNIQKIINADRCSLKIEESEGVFVIQLNKI